MQVRLRNVQVKFVHQGHRVKVNSQEKNRVCILFTGGLPSIVVVVVHVVVVIVLLLATTTINNTQLKRIQIQ